MIQKLKNSVVIVSTQRVAGILNKQQKRQALIMLVLLVANTFLELFGLAAVIPLISMVLEEDAVQNSDGLSYIYNMLGFSNNNYFLYFLSASFLLVILVRGALSIYIYHKQARFSFGLYEYFATQLHRYFYSKGYLYFKSKDSNKIVRDINLSSDQFARNIIMPLIIIFTEIFLLFLVTMGLVFYQPVVSAMLFLVLLPVAVLFLTLVKQKIQAYREKDYEIQAETLRNLFQSIFGYVDVQVGNMSETFFEKYKSDVKNLRDIRAYFFTLNQAPQKVLELGMMLGIVVIILIGTNVMPNKADLALTLGVLALAAYRTLPSFNRIILNLMNLRSHQHIMGVIEQLKGFSHRSVEQVPLSFEHEIALKNLSFSYEPGIKPNVLEGMTVSIEKGQRVGIIGRSGSGKTTLVNLLLRFLHESEGQIKVDGHPLNDSNVEAWRDMIGYVQQDVYILNDSLAKNIAFGHEEVDEARVKKVVEQASLESLVDSLPHGIHTPIGERGSQISGGQRQRIGVARALYEGAQILIFDEATSALDSETEREITDSIQKLSSRHFTMLIIAHRFTTLKYCDRIIELENGRLKKEMTYHELMESAVL